MPAAAIHMRQFGQVTPWRAHSICASVWRNRSRGSFSGGPEASSFGLQTGMMTLSNRRSLDVPGYLPVPKRMATSMSSVSKSRTS
jgi:hypothetical protein